MDDDVLGTVAQLQMLGVRVVFGSYLLRPAVLVEDWDMVVVDSTISPSRRHGALRGTLDWALSQAVRQCQRPRSG